MPEHYSYKEEDILGRYKQIGALRYKDPEAYYCQTCSNIYSVQCPNCKTWSSRGHASEYGLSTFRRTGTTFERYDGFIWTSIQCCKCDYSFKVICKQ